MWLNSNEQRDPVFDSGSCVELSSYLSTEGRKREAPQLRR